jgi:molybdenum cofactor synthesis domain-containing protein
MNKTEQPIKRVALLATGDEIVNGDILNTNGQRIAQHLFNAGIHIGQHMIVSDDQKEMASAILFLLQDNDALIITGGLGPTSDDRTRFAVADAIQEELVFDEPSWQNIVDRFQRFHLHNQPESNRQQALFPTSAQVIQNDNGTANACQITHQNKLLFMLPGPPSECLPIFTDTVFPALIQHEFATSIIHKKWLLFGVSEGSMAEIIDNIAKPFNITTGYRARVPYLEVKAHSLSQENMDAFIHETQSILEEHLINHEGKTASEKLISLLAHYPEMVYIQDEATHGHLEKTLINEKTYMKLNFLDAAESDPQTIPTFVITAAEQDKTNVRITIQHANNKPIHQNIAWRGKRTVLFVTELVCQTLYQQLTAR